MSKKGKLICLEGIDGSGKSTVVSRVVNELVRNYRIAAVLTREPTSGPIGKLIREYLDGSKKAWDPYTIQMLMRADRLEHLADEAVGIRKMLDGGIHVICDRYMLSSVVYATYQSCPMIESYPDDENPISVSMTDEEYDEIMAEHRSFVQLVRDEMKANLYDIRHDQNNDLVNDMYTIRLMVSPDEALERINKRSSETGEAISIYEEKEKLTKLVYTYNTVTQLLRSNGFNIIEVDASRAADEVYKEVLSHVKNIISL